MIKHIIALIALSIIVVLTLPYAQQVMSVLINAHNWVAEQLADVFSGGQTGLLLRGLFALLSIPLVTSLVPAALYWLVRRQWFPYFMECVWVIWLLQAGALAILYKTAMTA